MERNAGAEKAGPENRAGLAKAFCAAAGTDTPRLVFIYRAKRADSLEAERSQKLRAQRIPAKTKTTSPTNGKKAAHRLQIPWKLPDSDVAIRQVSLGFMSHGNVPKSITATIENTMNCILSISSPSKPLAGANDSIMVIPTIRPTQTLIA
jgi:hypothetical protein